MYNSGMKAKMTDEDAEEAIQALEEAIHIIGGQAALARKLGLKQGHIWWWLYRSKKVPAEYAIPIEELTLRQVTRYRLCPKVFGSPPRGQKRRVEALA